RWAVPRLVVLALRRAGVCLMAACVNLCLRGVRYLVQVTLAFGIFFTPVFYDSTRLGARGASLVMLNPLAPVLEGLRLSVADGHSLLQPLVVDGITAWSPWMLFYPAVFAVACLTLAALLYDRLELTFAGYLCGDACLSPRCDSSVYGSDSGAETCTIASGTSFLRSPGNSSVAARSPPVRRRASGR